MIDLDIGEIDTVTAINYIAKLSKLKSIKLCEDCLK